MLNFAFDKKWVGDGDKGWRELGRRRWRLIKVFFSVHVTVQ
jgi:hypothetical protein